MFIRDEEGQVLPITALCLLALMGFMGLAIDSGVLFQAKRRIQTAADAAAVAGTIDHLANQSQSSAVAAGLAASAANGYTNGSGGISVTVNDPPLSGPNVGNTVFVEAIVSVPVHTVFMSFFGYNPVTVKARSVAGAPSTGDICIWLMGTTGQVLYMQGAYDIEAPSCGAYVNSTSSNAIGITGNGGTFNTKFLQVVGNTPPGHEPSPTTATMNATPRSSPWGHLTGPTPTSGCGSTSTATSLTGTVAGPGAGNTICYSNAVTLNGATMGPGLYMFENGVTISGTVTVNSGTIDIYSGTFNQGNALLNITAPTSGTYNGIAIMQPASNTNELQVQFGSGNQTLDGYIYAPGAEVYLQDNGGGVVATGVVANLLYDKSSSVRIPSYDLAHPTTTLNRSASMVE